MSESTAQLKVGAALDGSFETVTRTVKTKLKELSDTAKDTGDKLGGMGDGTTQSAQKIEQATKSMVSSIQRTTALMDSGARGSVEYYKALANQRGVDANVLKPYLDQLEAVKVKQAQASAAMLSGGQSLDKIGMSAAATANALRGVPAQFTDIVTSIQGGQAPLTVFLQQGGQLKDMFGGAGNAAKALGGYVLGLINPYTLAAGAAAGLAIAYEAGAAESRAFNSALILSGNQAGVTTGQLMAMASSIDQISGTQGAAAEALGLFAASGKIGAENLEQFTLTAIRFEKVTGTAIGDTVKKFEELRKAPLEATLKLNETMGYLTQTVYDQIKALTEQGRVTDAAALAQEEFNKATASMAGDMEKNLGTVQRSWMSVKSAVVETWDAIKGIGRDAGLEGQVAAAQKMVDIRKQAANSIYGNASDLVKLSEAENQLKGYQELLKNQQLSAQYAAERAASVKSQVEFDKESDKYLSKAVQMQQAIAAAKERFAKVSQTPENLAKYTQEVEGIQKKFEESSKKSTKAIKENTDARRIQDERIRLSRALAIADGKAVEDANDAYKKMMDDLAKANDKYIESLNKSADAVAENVLKLNDEETALRISTEQNISLAQAIEGITIKRLEEKRVMELIGNNDAAAQAIAREIEQRKLLANAIDSKDARESVKKSAADAAAEWKRTSDQINSTLTDALMRGFESGKGFAKTLRDTVVNMFKTMILRPVISAIMSPVSAAIGGALGLSGAASAAGAAGTASTALSGISLAMSSFGTSFMSGLSTTFASGFSTLGLAVEGGLASIATGTSAGISAGIGQALGAVAGPLAIGAGVLAAFGAFRTTKKVGEGITGTLGGDNQSLSSFTELRKSGYLFGGPKYWDELKALDATMAKAINTDFDAIKTAAKGAASALGLSADSVAGFSKAIRLTFTGDKTKDEAIYKEYMSGVSEDLARTIIGSYKETVATVIDEIISGGGGEGGDITYSQVERQVKTSTYTPSEFARDGETASQTLQRLATSITLVNGTSDLLGNKLTEVGLKGANTASLLVDAFGGAERYAAQMGAYYQNFYTQEEQRAKLIENTSEAFTALGKTMPVLDESARAAYRSMVELAAGQDMSVEANRTAYASLLALQGPMNELAPAFDAVAESSKAAAEALAKTNQGWQDQLDVLTGAQTDRSIALRDAADESTRAIMRQVYAQQDLNTAATEATKVAEENSRALADAAIATAAAISSLLSSMVSRLASDVASAEQMINTSRAGIKTAYDAESAALKATQQRFASIGKTFADFASSLASSLDTPAQSFERLSAEYARLNDMARLGDTDAAAKAVSVGGQLKESIIARSGTREQAEREIAKLANSATATAAIANTQASLAELSLQQLDTQVSGFIDLNASVLSVKDAIEKFQADQAALDIVRNAHLKAVDLALASQSIFATGGTSAAAQRYTLKEVSAALIDYFAKGGDAANLAVSAQNNYGISADTLAGAATTIAGTTPVGSANTAANTAANAATTSAARAQAIRDYITMAQATMSGATLAQAIYGKAMQVGTTQAEIAAAIGWSTDAVSEFFLGAGIPKFAQGTNYTQEGLAYLHEGEAIIPKAYNPYNPNASKPGNNNAELIAEIRALRQEVANLKASGDATAANTRKFAQQFETASEGGRALLTEVYT
jgi:hypothetical protein